MLMEQHFDVQVCKCNISPPLKDKVNLYAQSNAQVRQTLALSSQFMNRSMYFCSSNRAVEFEHFGLQLVSAFLHTGRPLATLPSTSLNIS